MNISEPISKLPVHVLRNLDFLKENRANAREILSEYGDIPSDEDVCLKAADDLNGIHPSDREEAFLEIICELVDLIPKRPSLTPSDA